MSRITEDYKTKEPMGSTEEKLDPEQAGTLILPQDEKQPEAAARWCNRKLLIVAALALVAMLLAVVAALLATSSSDNGGNKNVTDPSELTHLGSPPPACETNTPNSTTAPETTTPVPTTSISTPAPTILVSTPATTTAPSTTDPAPTPSLAALWEQVGMDMDDEAASGQFGHSVSLSADGTTVAIGAPYNEGNGVVRVFRVEDDQWAQVGMDIYGEATYEASGYSVSMSADGLTVAIGAPRNGYNGFDSGQVRVYRWGGEKWNRIGNNIHGEEEEDEFGYSVSLSADATTVAVGAPYHRPDGSTNVNGQVRVFREEGGEWIQVGSNLDGKVTDAESGTSVSLSADGLTVAIGTPFNGDDNGQDSGHVRVYRVEGGQWIQVGSDIGGEADNDISGVSVSLSADGKTVAIGAPDNDGNGLHAGHARVFREEEGQWIQIGSDLDGDVDDYNSGYRVSLSADGTTVAVGVPRHGDGAGLVRVFRVAEGGEWMKLGSDIDGKSSTTWSEWSVSLSEDGSTVVVGELEKTIGTDSGHVRVYHLVEQ